MVERIKELRPELQAEALGEVEPFEDAQIPILESGAVERVRSAGAKRCRAGLREGRRIKIETAGSSQFGIGFTTGKWIADTVRVHGVVAVHCPQVASTNGEWASGLSGDNTVELPVTQPTSHESVAIHVGLAPTEGKFPQEIANEAVTNVEHRIAHLVTVVIGILRQLAGSQVVAEISKTMAVGVAQGIGQAAGPSLPQLNLETVEVGIADIRGGLVRDRLGCGA